MTNSNLPILNTISYSSLSDWQKCSWYFKVKHIDKIPDFSSSVETHYGTLIHRFIQQILMNEITPIEAHKKFTRIWKKFTGIYKKYITIDINFAFKSSQLIFENIKEKLEEEFPGYKVVAVEYKLIQPSSEKWNQNFKGFIDLILMLPDGNIKIIDLKTSSSLYTFNKYRDKFKDYQLVLYKLFYSIQASVELENIDLCFVVLDKTKAPISLLKITSGAKKLDNALEWLSSGLRAINRGIFIKNRSNCQLYGKPCKFYKSEYCK